jgi:hypothetical protein
LSKGKGSKTTRGIKILDVAPSAGGGAKGSSPVVPADGGCYSIRG